MRKLRLVVATILAAGVVSACTVPHKKSDFSVEKVSVSQSDAQSIFARYRKVRGLAVDLKDPSPLSTVETGPMLAIDSGSFKLAQAQSAKSSADAPKAEVLEVKPILAKKYPLWFMAQVRDRDKGVVKVQIYERSTSADSWFLVASPETLIDTSLPALRSGKNGTIVPVGRKNKSGLSMSPQTAADDYAAALAKPDSKAAARFENDGFIRQMTAAADVNKALKNVTFTQTWAADDVEFAARTSDGGILIWATLLRLDGYGVKNGVSVAFPPSSPQQSFLGKNISTSGRLRYYHQVLLYLPGTDGGKPRVLGQYGGVVGADGF